MKLIESQSNTSDALAQLKTSARHLLIQLGEAKLRLSLQYGARVKELTELGFRIKNRTERRSDKVCGYFRLETGPGEPTEVASASLFGNLNPDPSYRE